MFFLAISQRESRANEYMKNHFVFSSGFVILNDESWSTLFGLSVVFKGTERNFYKKIPLGKFPF